MYSLDLIVDTTYATTSAIPLPGGASPVATLATTLYVDGGGVIRAVSGFGSATTAVQVSSQLVKNNVLKLRYLAVGDVLLP